MSKHRAAEQNAGRAASSEALAGLANADGVPRYKAVKAAITAALIAGEWAPGSALPEQVQLAERFGVSVGTLRKATDELVAERILIRRQGLGTFVALHGPARNRYHFFHIVERDGTRELPEPQMLDFERGTATDNEAAALEIAPAARVLRITNLLSLRGEPAVLDTIVVAAARFPGLTAARFGQRDSTIYSLYQTEYGINVVRTREWLSASAANRATARALGMAPGTPVLTIKRIAYTYHDVPVELRLSAVDTRARAYEAEQGKEG